MFLYQMSVKNMTATLFIITFITKGLFNYKCFLMRPIKKLLCWTPVHVQVSRLGVDFVHLATRLKRGRTSPSKGLRGWENCEIIPSQLNQLVLNLDWLGLNLATFLRKRSVPIAPPLQREHYEGEVLKCNVKCSDFCRLNLHPPLIKWRIWNSRTMLRLLARCQRWFTLYFLSEKHCEISLNYFHCS